MDRSNTNKIGGLRKLSVTAGDVNAFYTRAIADQQITYVIELNGYLDIERIEKSVATLLKRLPILQSVIRVNGLHFKRIVPYSSEHNVCIVNMPDNPQESILKFVSKPCNPETELPLKLLLLRSNNNDTLCVKIDHVVSDAGGLKHLLYLLSDIYTNGNISLPINYNRGMMQVYRKFSIMKLIHKGLKANMPSPGVALIEGPYANNDFFIEHVTLEPDMFERLHSKAKDFDTTINNLILTAVYRTVFDYPAVNAGIGYPIMVPVDMRRYLKYNKRGLVANYSSSLFPILEKVENENFMDTLRRVNDCMIQFKNDLPGLGMAAKTSVGAHFACKQMKELYDAASSHESGFINLTNFGIIDDQLLLFDKISVKDVYGIGPFQNAPALIIAVSTYKDTLNFAVQGSDRQKVQAFVKEFLKKTITELKCFIEGC